MQLPALLDVTEDASCLCKDCLIARINEKLVSLYLQETTEVLVQKAAQYQNQMPVKGLDFYQNEDGYRVMTKWAHLKRGYCCGNGCLHCPY